jgi:hypothetical protein
MRKKADSSIANTDKDDMFVNLSLGTLPEVPPIALTYLSLTQCMKITSSGVVILMHYCRNLRTLSLRGCRVSDAALYAIARNCREIEKLDLYRCNHVNDTAMSALLRNLRSLRSLNLSLCARLTDVTIVTLVNCCTNLVSLNLSHNSHYSDRAMATLAVLPELQDLDLANCHFLRPTGVVHIATVCGPSATTTVVASKDYNGRVVELNSH